MQQEELEQEENEKVDRLSLLLEGPSKIIEQSPSTTPIAGPNPIQNQKEPLGAPILSSSSVAGVQVSVQIEKSPSDQPLPITQGVPPSS